MADVNLTVEVREVGVRDAISRLEQLRKSGLDTSSGMVALSGAATEASRRISAMAAMAASSDGRIKGMAQTLGNSAKAAGTMSVALRTLEQNYARLSRLHIGASPLERLTRAGGGSLVAGRGMAEQVKAMRDAFSADIVSDYNAVLQQEAQLSQARISRTQAMANVERAQWERSLQGMTKAEQQQARLTRATQEYQKAQVGAQRAAAYLRGAPNDPARIAIQTKALNTLAQATREVTAAEREGHNQRRMGEGNAFQSSYSYFILAGLATQAASAIRDVGAFSLQSAADIERSFADVTRTTEGTNQQLDSLRRHLIDLSTATPVAFTELAEIATLGNQLGIAAEDVEAFTTTMAQYTAVSGQTAENAATAFGRISNLTGLAASEYSNLASAITYVARTTVATESTIQNTAREITALASGAGFSADAIVGLAGALSSLAIPPERARGALSLYFGALNTAVANGGPKLEAFAELTNMTADTLNQLVRENRGQEVFTAFIQGLSELDTVAKTSALDTLGLSTIRVDQTMRALSQNVPLVTSSFEGANRAFTENVEIGNQYAIIQKTLAAQWEIFQNAVQNAAGALGDEFAPAAAWILSTLTDLLVRAREFSQSPLGAALMKVAGGAAILVGSLAALVGAVALARASWVVFTFAITGFGWETTMSGLRGWIAGIFDSDRAVRQSTRNMTAFRAAMSEQTAAMRQGELGARALTAAMRVLNTVLVIAAITAVTAAITNLWGTIERAIDPSKRLTDDLTGLKDALASDNPRALEKQTQSLSRAATGADGSVSAFNASILSAIEMQERAEAALRNTNVALADQKFALGDASKAWIAEALKAQEDIADIIDGRDWWEQLWEDFSVPGSPLGLFRGWQLSGDELVSRDSLREMILGGLDVNELSQIAITQGQDAAMRIYMNWRRGFIRAGGSVEAADNMGDLLKSRILPSVLDAYADASTEAALFAGQVDDTGLVVAAAAADFDKFGQYIGSAIENGEAVVATFAGLRSEISAFRDAIQGAISGTVDFEQVFKRAEGAAEAAAKAAGKNVKPKPIDAKAFGKNLTEATNEALKFYRGINRVAERGGTSFALQLAELGPEAQSVLSSVLKLDGTGLAKLEADARFAAFIASDAFKNTLDGNLTNANEALARIFERTGSLDEVRRAIAAMVAGPEAMAEYEREWLANNPTWPLNLTPELHDPSPEDIELIRQQIEGSLTVTPKVIYNPLTSAPDIKGTTYTDTATGASITLPAALDGKALKASLDFWRKNQNMNPEDIAAKLNTEGFNRDIDIWSKNHGPITIYGNVIPRLPAGGGGGGRPWTFYRDGGQVEAPRFASGGQWGQFRGPGTGTSDSIWARVSNGEFISTAAATKFWGTDFFDSLNRKTLPASFMSLLGAAAVSGNRGPEKVVNVNVTQVNPLTRDPLKQLRENSEMVASGVWE